MSCAVCGRRNGTRSLIIVSKASCGATPRAAAIAGFRTSRHMYESTSPGHIAFTVTLYCRLHHRLRLRQIADVDVHAESIGPESLDLVDRLAAVSVDGRQVGDGDAHAFLRQLVGDPTPNASRAAGDDRDGVL